MISYLVLLSFAFLPASKSSLRQLNGIKSAISDPLRRRNAIMQQRVTHDHRLLKIKPNDDGFYYGGGGGPPAPPCQYTPPAAGQDWLYPACPAGTPAPPYPAPVSGGGGGGGGKPCPNCAIPQYSAIHLADISWFIWVYETATQLYKLYKQVKQLISIVNSIIDTVKVILANCIDGDMLLPMYPDGKMKVSSLQVGDMILGAKSTNIEDSWCKVLAVYPVNSDGVTFGGFTYDHLIVDNPFNNGTSLSVTIAGQLGEEKKGPIYTLMTDCDATYNDNGDLFTPISSAFCPDMPWSDYLEVMGAIRKVMAKTGYFWFNLDVYYDNPADPNYPSYLGALPEMCHQTLQCSQTGDCKKFEETSSQFMLLHLKADELAAVQKVFPNLGNSDSVQGTLTAAVLGSTDSANSWQSILLAGVVAIIVLGVVAFFVWKQMKSPAGADPAAAAGQSEKPLDYMDKGIEISSMASLEENGAATTTKE